MKAHISLMINVVFCLGTIILSNPIVLRQAATTAEDDLNRLKYLNSLYIQSYIRSDTATYNALLLAEDFTQQNPDGSKLTRAATLQRFGKPRFDAIEYFYAEDIEVKFLSPDKAVVSAKNPACFKIQGKITKTTTRYQDTYVKRNGVWKCISAVIANAP
jgi:Domain of unknown function (DUF4440)